MNLEMFSLTRKQKKERERQHGDEAPASFPSSAPAVSVCQSLFSKHVIEDASGEVRQAFDKMRRPNVLLVGRLLLRKVLEFKIDVGGGLRRRPGEDCPGSEIVCFHHFCCISFE